MGVRLEILSILWLLKTVNISGCSKVAVKILHEVLPPDLGVRKFGTGIKLDNTFHPRYECGWIASPTIGELPCVIHPHACRKSAAFFSCIKPPVLPSG